MLDFGGMLKAAIDDGTETFRLENEVLESRGVDANVVTPDLSWCVWVEREREREIKFDSVIQKRNTTHR